MDRRKFWDLIEASRQAAGNDENAQIEALRVSLQALPVEEVVRFDEIFSECMRRAYRYDLWAGATIIDGFWVSDDAFEYFRYWLISRGQEVFENAVADPESLADVVEQGEVCEFEAFGYVASWVWEEKTGQTMDKMHPFSGGESKDPAGENYEEEALRRRFPRLLEKFHEEDDDGDQDDEK